MTALDSLLAPPAADEAVTGVTLDFGTPARPSDLGFVTFDPSQDGARYSLEEWKPIPGWRYDASSLGRVRTQMWIDDDGILHLSTILAQTLDTRPGKGYRYVTLHDGPRRRKAWVHALVLEAHVGARPSRLHQACHWNGVRTDNRLCNLRWGTRAEQEEDKRRHRQERQDRQEQQEPLLAGARLSGELEQGTGTGQDGPAEQGWAEGQVERSETWDVERRETSEIEVDEKTREVKRNRGTFCAVRSVTARYRGRR